MYDVGELSSFKADTLNLKCKLSSPSTTKCFADYVLWARVWRNFGGPYYYTNIQTNQLHYAFVSPSLLILL